MPWTKQAPPKCAINWSDAEKAKCVAAANAVLREGGSEQDAIYACIRNSGRSTKKSAANLSKTYLIDGKPVTLNELVRAYVEKRDFEPNVGGGVDRDKLKDSDFVFSDERKFPVVTAGDVADAVSSWGRYKGKHTFEEFKSRLTALANRKKFALPKSWGKEKKVEKSTNLNEVVKIISEAWHKEFAQSGDPNGPMKGYVEEIFDDYVIGNVDSELARYPFEIAEDGSFIWGTKQPVVRRILYIPTSPMKKSEDGKTFVTEILKADEERRLVYGAVLKPGVIDSQGDKCSEREVELAAHRFLMSKISDVAIDEQHDRDVPVEEACPVESYVTQDIVKMGDKELPKGTWIMVTHIPSDDLWDKVKKHQINGFSVRGWGKRKKVS